MKVVYMCHGGFKNRGSGSGPLLKMGSFQNLPTREKRVLELKITKKHIFLFLKRRIFSSCTGRKSGDFRSC